MPKFYIAYKIDHIGETVVEADSLEQAKAMAECNNTKAYADWDLLEDVSDAEITEVEEVGDDFEL